MQRFSTRLADVMFCKSGLILGHQKCTEAHEVPYELMIRSVTDIRYVAFLFPLLWLEMGELVGVMAKAHGNAGVKKRKSATIRRNETGGKEEWSGNGGGNKIKL